MFIEEKLQMKENFSTVESMVADYILERKELIAQESLRQIADKLFISPPSIVRLCKKLGFRGFNDFKESYLEELRYFYAHFQEIDPNFPFVPGDDDGILSHKLAKLYIEAVEDTLSIIDRNMFARAVEILRQAETIYVCGAGSQRNLAEMFKYRLAMIEKNVFVSFDMTDLYYKASYAPKSDCFLFLSYSGETGQIVHIAKKVRQRRLPAVAITSLGKNSLSDLISCVLRISTREKLHNNLGNFSSSISEMYLLDLLYANLFNQDYQNNYMRRKKATIEFERYRKTDNSILKDVD